MARVLLRYSRSFDNPRSTQGIEVSLNAHRKLVRGSLLMIGLAACGSEHPTAPPAVPQPPDVVVDWAGLQRLYDDPLYRRLPQLIDDAAARQTLEGAMSTLTGAIQSKDLSTVRQALATLHDVREAYENGRGSDRREQPQLIALAFFEIRGMAYIHYDSLHLQEVQFVSEDGS